MIFISDQWPSCYCGNVIKNQPIPAIVGGTEAKVNSIPWQVLIAIRYLDIWLFPLCGGTIIGPSTILTGCLKSDKFFN